MRKADRLFQLVNLVRSHQSITAQKLSERLGVSVRTVYRYIDDLSLSNIPIYGEAGVGYRLREGFELPPLALTSEEMEALILGVEMVSVSTGKKLPIAAKSLLHKIEAALSDRESVDFNAKIRALSVTDRTYVSQHWDVLREAIRATNAISFSYDTLEGVKSERIVYPLGLFYWGGKWTLGAWCTLRYAFREFRIDRITGLRVIERTFQNTTEVNLQAYMRHQSARKSTTDTTVSVVQCDSTNSSNQQRS